MTGISLSGEKSNGPMPYASTYMESPIDAVWILTPKRAMTPGMEGE